MAEKLIDPDCAAGKHARPEGGGCVGGPCECWCHAQTVIAPGAFASQVGKKVPVTNTAGEIVGECEITAVDGDRVRTVMRIDVQGEYDAGIYTADIPTMSFGRPHAVDPEAKKHPRTTH